MVHIVVPKMKKTKSKKRPMQKIWYIILHTKQR